MLLNSKLENILFLDIETVPQVSNYFDFSERMQELWEKKSKYFLKEGEKAEDKKIFQRSGIFAEFGKIICISVGIIFEKNGERFFRKKSFFDNDEKKLLIDFNKMLKKTQNIKMLCGHNIKEFDVPYIARRSLINGLKLPYLIDISGKKPWELKHILDTMEMWKFGDYKNFTSLDLLTEVFNIPTPKNDMDGSKVADAYWKENNLQKIVNYCQKDVFATTQLFLRLKSQELISQKNVTIAKK